MFLNFTFLVLHFSDYPPSFFRPGSRKLTVPAIFLMVFTYISFFHVFFPNFPRFFDLRQPQVGKNATCDGVATVSSQVRKNRPAAAAGRKIGEKPDFSLILVINI